MKEIKPGIDTPIGSLCRKTQNGVSTVTLNQRNSSLCLMFFCPPASCGFHRMGMHQAITPILIGPEEQTVGGSHRCKITLLQHRAGLEVTAKSDIG